MWDLGGLHGSPPSLQLPGVRGGPRPGVTPGPAPCALPWRRPPCRLRAPLPWPRPSPRCHGGPAPRGHVTRRAQGAPRRRTRPRCCARPGPPRARGSADPALAARVPHGLTSVLRAVEDVGLRGPRQEPCDGSEARVGVRDAGARGAPGAAGAGGAGADPGGRRDPRAVRAAALRLPPGPARRRGALPGPQGAQGAAQGDREGAQEAQPAARGGAGSAARAPRGRCRSSRGRGAGAAVPDLPGGDAGAPHAGALPPLVLRGVHRAGAAGALRLPRVRPLLRAAGGEPAPRRAHAGDPRRRAAPARLRGFRHHHHPVRLPARRAGGGTPKPRCALPRHHARGVPARLPRGEQGAGAVPQGLRPAPHLHRGHLADHRPRQRHHLERHPPQDQLHRRAPAVRVPRPHVPGPGAGGAAGQGHHRGLSGGRGSTGTPQDHPGQPGPPPHPGRGIPPDKGGRRSSPPGQRDPPFSGTPLQGTPHTNRQR